MIVFVLFGVVRLRFEQILNEFARTVSDVCHYPCQLESKVLNHFFILLVILVFQYFVSYNIDTLDQFPVEFFQSGIDISVLGQEHPSCNCECQIFTKSENLRLTVLTNQRLNNLKKDFLMILELDTLCDLK